MSEVRLWARGQRQRHPEITRMGLFGSYARGDYAPGSDVDLLILVESSRQPVWFLRGLDFDASDLPMGADMFVYTESEAERMRGSNRWFSHVMDEAVWLQG